MSAPKRFAMRLDLSDASPDLIARFWSKVTPGAADECWEWTGHCKANGYGQFVLRKGVFMTASRVSLALKIGVVEAGIVACHSCDNPPCVNPLHLFAGTSRDNANDSVEKGRARRAHGVAHPDARLTIEAVREIRATPIIYGARTRLARDYGVCFRTIQKVLDGTTWTEVDAA